MALAIDEFISKLEDWVFQGGEGRNIYWRERERQRQ